MTVRLPAIEHASDHGGGSVLDQEALENLLVLGGDDGPELVLELVDLFVGDARQRVAKMVDSATSQDYEGIAASAHALKSASATIGALRFSEACSQLEGLSRGDDRDSIPGLVSRASGMFNEVCEALSELKGNF